MVSWDQIVFFHLIKIIDIPLVVFHALMAVFLSKAIRLGQKPFASGFYVLFLVLSIVDMTALIWRTFFITCFPLHGSLMLSSTLLANVYDTGGSFLTYSQKTLRATLTFNRLTIFVFPQKHAKVFHLRRLKFIILASFAAPVPLLAYRPFFTSTFGATASSVEVHYVDAHIQKVSKYINIVGRTVLYSACFFMQAATILSYYRFNRVNPSASASVKHQRGTELRLVVHTLMEFVFETIMMAYMLTASYGSFVGNQSFQAWGRQYLGWANDLCCVCGSLFLFITSQDVRRGFCRFYGISWDNLPKPLRKEFTIVSTTRQSGAATIQAIT